MLERLRLRKPSVEARVRRIEIETGIHTPEFISSLAPVNPVEASKLAIKLGLVDREYLIDRFGSLDSREAQIIAAYHGLEYLRNNTTESEKSVFNHLALFERFNKPDLGRIKSVGRAEIVRRQRRDQDILKMELSFLAKRGVKTPDFGNLTDYCSWIPEAGGHNPRIRKYGWHDSWLQTADDVYWDLTGHYSEISEKARKTFDPLTDWELYLKGKKNIVSGQGSWNLNSMGEGDLSWYAIMLMYDGRTLYKPSRAQMRGRLLTHTTDIGAANQIMKRGYLLPRVCYSATRVIRVRQPIEVTFIFDRKIMEGIYSIEPYQEESHEKEMRSREINSIQMAIACVPTVTQIFKGFQGRGQGTVAIGEETIAQWSDRYEKEQRLWTPEEEKAIHSIAATISQ